ncbi:hypothetical protein TNCV_3708201 [Trichonephila clavipes]|nr:hypothetical protein TNCV_3708201 [Trichonephila clavipes]
MMCTRHNKRWDSDMVKWQRALEVKIENQDHTLARILRISFRSHDIFDHKSISACKQERLSGVSWKRRDIISNKVAARCRVRSVNHSNTLGV